MIMSAPASHMRRLAPHAQILLFRPKLVALENVLGIWKKLSGEFENAPPPPVDPLKKSQPQRGRAPVTPARGAEGPVGRVEKRGVAGRKRRAALRSASASPLGGASGKRAGGAASDSAERDASCNSDADAAADSDADADAGAAAGGGDSDGEADDRAGIDGDSGRFVVITVGQDIRVVRKQRCGAASSSGGAATASAAAGAAGPRRRQPWQQAPYARLLFQQLVQAGYAVKTCLLDAASFGAAQTRGRTFFFAALPGARERARIFLGIH